MTNIVSSWIDNNNNNKGPFIIDGVHTHSYPETVQNIKKFARLLRNRGIEPGDKVAIILRNSFSSVCSYLGTIYAGAVVVPLSPQIDIKKAEELLKEAEARLLIIDDRIIENFEFDKNKILAESEILNSISLEIPDETPRVPKNGFAALMYTSGSTGQAKGVFVSHQNLQFNTRDIINSLRIDQNDRAHLVLPLSYCFGTSVLHSHFSAGASIVIDNQFMFPQKTLEKMIKHKSTIFAGVPSHYLSILKNTSVREMNFPHLRLLQQAGGHLSSEQISEVTAVFNSAKFAVMYGQTEATARLTVLPPEQLNRKIGSVGKALESVTLSIVDENGVKQPPLRVGEISVSGKNICQYYLVGKNVEKRESSSLRTGDLGYLDEDGFLFITGRKSQFIKLAGRRTSLQELEISYRKFEKIDDLFIQIISDETRGEAVKLLLFTKKSDIQKENLIQEAKEYYEQNLKLELRPTVIEVLNKKPLNDRGKVDFTLLKKSS